MAVLCFFFPGRLQAWNVKQLQHRWLRWITPKLFVQIAGSRFALWWVRFGGLVLFLMFGFGLYIVLKYRLTLE